MALQHDSVTYRSKTIAELYDIAVTQYNDLVSKSQFTMNYVHACYKHHIKLIKDKDTELTDLDIKYFECAHTLLSKIDPDTHGSLNNARASFAISIQNMVKFAIYQKIDEQLINRLKEILPTHK